MSRPISITMIISRFAPSIGGTERQALLLSKELIRRGMKVDILTQRYDKTLLAEEVMEGVPVHRLAATGNSLKASGVFLLHGLKYLMTHRPTILHAHMLATPAVMASWAHRLGGGPVVVKIACSGSYGEVSVGKSSWLGRRKLSGVFSTASRLICVTNDIKKELKAEGLNENRLAEIPNGVDTNQFSPAPNDDIKKALRIDLGLKDGIWIIFAGRLTRQKRPDLVLKAFLKTAERRSDLRLLMVGEGDEQASLMEIAQQHKSGSRVRWAGRRLAMAPLYRAADIFVLPSEAEGMSNSLLEAMSVGLACIVSRTAMAEEMIGKTEGVLIKPDNESKLAATFDQLAGDPKRCAALGQAARARVLARYSIKAVADQYVKLYTQLALPTQEAA